MVFAFKIRASCSVSGGLGPHHGSALDHVGGPLDRLLVSINVQPSTYILYPPLLHWVHTKFVFLYLFSLSAGYYSSLYTFLILCRLEQLMTFMHLIKLNRITRQHFGTYTALTISLWHCLTRIDTTLTA